MVTGKKMPLIALGIIVLIISLGTYTWAEHKSRVLSAEIKPPLGDANDTPIVLDFNTPTPSPTPSPTPTPSHTPTPTHTPTPSPSPTPTPIPATAAQLDAWFTQYANHYSVDRSLLWKIAACETGFRAHATNWIYAGMFQFSPNTWSANRAKMGLDTNPVLRFNAEESIRTAAFLLSTRGPGAWPSCSK
jgi:hypothetical protein